MGREIGIIVKHKGKELYSNYVCGRDDGTTFLASYILNHNSEEIEEQGDTIVLHYGDEDIKYIEEGLQEYADKDQREIDKAYWALEDLREARKHAPSMDAFTEFSDAIDNTLNWLDHENYSRSGNLIEYIDHALYVIEEDYLKEHSYINKSKTEAFKDYDIEIYLSE